MKISTACISRRVALYEAGASCRPGAARLRPLVLLLSLLLTSPLSVWAQHVHSAMVLADGSLWAWGRNDYGQVGVGSQLEQPVPARVGTLSTWQSVSVGGLHTLAIRQDGTLWAWGDNSQGQLGIGIAGNYLTQPVRVGTGTTWRSVSASTNHTLAIRQDGTLWAWGYNTAGQLGIGSTTSTAQPVQVGTATNWASVTSHGNCTLAIRTDGTLWAWGDNSTSQLGTGISSQQNSPIQVGTDTNWQSVSTGSNATVALRTNGTLWVWGFMTYGTSTQSVRTPTQVGTLTTWREARAGYGVMLARQQNGTLWSLAAQLTAVQLGTDTNWQSLVLVTPAHFVATRQDGTVWAAGSNGNGQVGSATLGMASHALPLQSNPLIWQNTSAGGYHTVAIRQDGTLWTTGDNSYGQLGIGATGTGPRYFVQVGTATTWQRSASCNNYSLALRTDGTLWSWGQNNSGQLGIGSLLNQSAPVQVGSATWRSVSAGTNHAMAIRTDGTLWAWGSSASGQLGLGNTTQQNSPMQVGSATNWQSVCAGNSCTLAIRTDGTLWAWGLGSNGQLGTGSTTQQNSPVQVGTGTTWRSVSIGDQHVVATQTDGSLWVWGSNNYGQLGLGGSVTQLTTPQRLGTLTTWQSASAGGTVTLAWRTDGTLWAWGSSAYGALGTGYSNTNGVPAQVGAATAWQSVQTSGRHTVAMSQNNNLWAWGDNGLGQLGRPYSTTTPLQILFTTVTASQAPARMTPAISLHAWPTCFGTTTPQLRITGASAGSAELLLVDALGRVHLRRHLTLAPGDTELPLPEAMTLPAGLYHLQLVQGARRVATSLIRE